VNLILVHSPQRERWSGSDQYGWVFRFIFLENSAFCFDLIPMALDWCYFFPFPFSVILFQINSAKALLVLELDRDYADANA
jgi:hypothetical protein